MSDMPVAPAAHDTLHTGLPDFENEPAARFASLERFLADVRFDAGSATDLGDVLCAMIERGLDRLPLPGQGATLMRWRALAAVAARDLGLVKFYEGHTDAFAILAELHGPAARSRSLWGTWAAEPPDAKVVASAVSEGVLHLHGTKAWCSGAEVVSHALVTAWLDDAPVLAAVDLQQPSISMSCENWHAVGMQASASGDVRFEGARAMQVGGAHDYVVRPGFWHGGGGVAACWYGAACGIANVLGEAVIRRSDPHALAHLGAVDASLAGAGAVLRETANFIDAHPEANAMRVVLRARLAVERAASTVMTHASRALGAGPLCRDARLARLMADLPVFLRQSHAERDLASLGNTYVDDPGHAWLL
ncbi:acyl-CoA dehydrogenase family protein [Paraburkholderia gardini]|uniref:Acyl-CoA dehydrogenase n=1 Tax=Paraburkholderia gardini TaxID=2823469 RepID=A0ABN7QUU0_9BURK|nr:acyl-CoA dehydrogenase family protein [Paraburkholderia gardini]CAG4916773.1 hypothetical protein R54767_04337 [Paraburkholderia gardini]